MRDFKNQEVEEREKAVYTHLVEKRSPSDDGSVEESDVGVDIYPPRKTNPIRRVLCTAGLLLLSALAVWGTTNIYQRVTYVDPQSLSCSCGGTTTEEAIRRGCIFTPLAIAWLPPHCIDMELSEEFDRSGDGPDGQWEYWADGHRGRALNRTEVGLLANSETGYFYSTQNWHITHCTFTWRKHYRSKTTGVTIERRSNGLDHIGHCESIFRIRGGLTDILTVAGIALDADDPGETDLSQIGHRVRL